MSLNTITIGTVDYIAYASVAEGNAYLNTDPLRGAAWDALDAEGKGKMLVSATRRLDLERWKGVKTGGEGVQEEKWPRTGVTYLDGTAVSTAEVPKELENATILLAGSIALDAKNADSGTSGSNVKRVKAGSAEVEYFRATTPGSAMQDESVMDLIRQFLAGSGVSTGLASGCDEESTFGDPTPWELTEGYP